ncbi:E3 ubiquitin-protein ligase RBBP6 [Quillaja saponaria]|uniref:E3 ubiquitin-protein ligase RBBP6 n=1 Tax=Quillaja saponaria TaxID=32244 RepID=A0AAD7LY46_QUISA|nr:E3 ubiquitin-protein ligase RBBP6 [Quillaja saponaria]KAJ7966365.1 E3 ubiquitin-protein ligase RBBP6 [Quillaja saponaria]
MTVRFKFRSSVNFDSVDIEGRSSISVRDLKANILRQKNLNICQNFDLVLSDAVTGLEYNDWNSQIPDGSCVIIRRVPAETTHTDMVKLGNFQSKETKIVSSLRPVNGKIDESDDFGVDIYPVPEVTISGSDFHTDLKILARGERDVIDAVRFSEPQREGCQFLEASDLSDAIPSGPSHAGKEGNSSESPLKPIPKDNAKPENLRVFDAIPPTIEHDNFPSELKCSLCNSFFKEAMMIPCCQHSFCKRCVCLVLLEKASCPKCYSTKCKVEDLLPNVSLTQAIDHFLESQMLIPGSSNALCQYAPDGESGIQGRDVSCNVTIYQNEPEFPHSPSAIGMGSNYNMGESAYEMVFRDNASKMKQIDEDKGIQKGGSLQMRKLILLSRGRETCGLILQREIRVLWILENDTESSPVGGRGAQGGDRTCYMCGSPNHLIRDCPVASSPHPPLQRGGAMIPGPGSGYLSQYWNTAPLPHVRPFTVPYGHPGMLPFNTAMFPVLPFAVPTYMPSAYGGNPSFSAFMKIGDVALPVETGGEHHESGSELLDHQNYEKRRKLSSDSLRRESSFDDDDYNERHHFKETESSGYHKPHMSREKKVRSTVDVVPGRRNMKHCSRTKIQDESFLVDKDNYHEKNSRSSNSGGGQGTYQCRERSSPEVEDMPVSSCSCNEERHKMHHQKCSRRHYERRENYGTGSDSSLDHHRIYKEKEVKRKRDKPDVKRNRHKRHSHLESGLEQSFSSNERKEKKHRGQRSRHSKPIGETVDDDLKYDRWQMGNEYDREDYRSYIQRRAF